MALRLSPITDTSLPYPIEAIPFYYNRLAPQGMYQGPYGGIYGFPPHKQRGGSMMLPAVWRGPSKIQLQEGYGKRRRHRRKHKKHRKC